ncbi:unnamed protein product [Amoebophrya sp. A120]|nr:unnamed protein product [Amoebophrya sp. A120]|eukprot:GSA120T00007909001.1
MTELDDELAAIRAKRQKAQETQQTAMFTILQKKREMEGEDPAVLEANAKRFKSATGYGQNPPEPVKKHPTAWPGGVHPAIASVPLAAGLPHLTEEERAQGKKLPTDDDMIHSQYDALARYGEKAVTGNAIVPVVDGNGTAVEEWLTTGFQAQLRKMESATNFKHGMKIIEKIWIHRHRHIPYKEQIQLYSILFTKPLTQDLIVHIDKAGGDQEKNDRFRVIPKRLVQDRARPTSVMKIRNRPPDKFIPNVPEWIDVMHLMKPIEIGLTQNLKEKTTADLIKALYAVVKVHLLDVPFQNRATFEPTSGEKNCMLKLQEMLKSKTAANGDELKTLSAKVICMLLYSNSLIANPNFISNVGALQKLALDKGLIRTLYHDVVRGQQIADMESAQVCELAYAVAKFNQLYTQTLASKNDLSAAAGLGIAHREPVEEQVFNKISEKIQMSKDSISLKHLADIVSVYALFGLKDEQLFHSLAPIFLTEKAKGKLNDFDFQQTLKAYIKFNLPLREEAQGFRNIAVIGKGDFTRPSDKPKKEKFAYHRPEPLQDR